MRFLKNTWIAATLCAAASVGTFLVPWGLAALSQWEPMADGTAVVEQPERLVYWEAEPEPEPVEMEIEVPEVETEAEAPIDAPNPDSELVQDPDAPSVPVAEPVLASTSPDGVRRTERRDRAAAARRARLRKARLRRLRKRRKCAKPHPSVRKGPGGTMEVDKAYVEAVTKNLKAFMELGHSRPHNEDGVKGWYITGFGCTSPVHKAGFRRRDILLTVNGKKTRSWAGVFLLYQKLKRKTEFEVELLRKGEAQTLQFRIVEDWTANG